jgi:hypothetical protein
MGPGPLGGDAGWQEREVPPVRGVRALMERAGARGQSPSVAGSPRTRGDSRPAPWRKSKPATGATPGRGRDWTRTIAAQLRSEARQGT